MDIFHIYVLRNASKQYRIYCINLLKRRVVRNLNKNIKIYISSAIHSDREVVLLLSRKCTYNNIIRFNLQTLRLVRTRENIEFSI